jgi:topoisomerase-4 subunit B
MCAKSNQVYDESKIKTLSSLEHIRLRTGMYIGRVGDGSHYDDGIYVLLKEVVDNAIDEFIMGHGRKVELALDGPAVTVRDYGRGIPLGKLVDCVSTINTGAKYNDEVFQFSVGLNGVGTKAVNALSSSFMVRSHREGSSRGRVCSREIGQGAQGKARRKRTAPWSVHPRPADLRPGQVSARARASAGCNLYTYLNAELTFLYNGADLVRRTACWT